MINTDHIFQLIGTKEVALFTLQKENDDLRTENEELKKQISSLQPSKKGAEKKV